MKMTQLEIVFSVIILVLFVGVITLSIRKSNLVFENRGLTEDVKYYKDLEKSYKVQISLKEDLIDRCEEVVDSINKDNESKDCLIDSLEQTIQLHKTRETRDNNFINKQHKLIEKLTVK